VRDSRRKSKVRATFKVENGASNPLPGDGIQSLDAGFGDQDPGFRFKAISKAAGAPFVLTGQGGPMPPA